MSDQTVETMVKTLIQAQVVQALKTSEGAIDSLVQAALSKPVDSYNGQSGGFGNKVPFLEYLVGSAIRDAAERAVRVVVKENYDAIEAKVRAALSTDDVVSAFTKAVVKAGEEDYKIRVIFETDNERR